MAVASCRGIDFENPRIVRIRNTLSLSEVLISEGLLEEARRDPGIEILS